MKQISILLNEVISPGVFLGEGKGVAVAVERLQRLAELLHAAVSMVKRLASLLLKLSPDHQQSAAKTAIKTTRKYYISGFFLYPAFL
jgi:hypothetical protein